MNYLNKILLATLCLCSLSIAAEPQSENAFWQMLREQATTDGNTGYVLWDGQTEYFTVNHYQADAATFQAVRNLENNDPPHTGLAPFAFGKDSLGKVGTLFVEQRFSKEVPIGQAAVFQVATVKMEVSYYLYDERHGTYRFFVDDIKTSFERMPSEPGNSSSAGGGIH